MADYVPVGCLNYGGDTPAFNGGFQDFAMTVEACVTACGPGSYVFLTTIIVPLDSRPGVSVSYSTGCFCLGSVVSARSPILPFDDIACTGQFRWTCKDQNLCGTQNHCTVGTNSLGGGNCNVNGSVYKSTLGSSPSPQGGSTLTTSLPPLSASDSSVLPLSTSVSSLLNTLSTITSASFSSPVNTYTSQSTSAPSQQEPSAAPSTPIAPIVGGVVGACVVLAIAIILFVVSRRARRVEKEIEEKRKSADSDPYAPGHSATVFISGINTVVAASTLADSPRGSPDETDEKAELALSRDPEKAVKKRAARATPSPAPVASEMAPALAPPVVQEMDIEDAVVVAPPAYKERF